MVPKSGYEYERLPPLDNKDACDKELCHIDRLLELAVASKMLAGAQYRIKGEIYFRENNYIFVCSTTVYTLHSGWLMLN